MRAFLMRRFLTAALVFPLAHASSVAQTAPAKAEAACYQDKGVDEYVAELNKREKGSRNPLPNDICIFGMCAHTGVGPKERTPDPGPPSTEKPTLKRPVDPDESSSKKETADVAGTIVAESSAYDPVTAARDVDVGDYYFREKNYRGALMRYGDAHTAKPGDAAIHLRMARAWEKLGAPERAYLEYGATVRLEAEGKAATEARSAMERLRPTLKKAGVEPSALVVDGYPEKAPCLAAPATK